MQEKLRFEEISLFGISAFCEAIGDDKQTERIISGLLINIERKGEFNQKSF